MILRGIQRREVVVGRLDEGTVLHGIAKPHEDVLDLLADLAEGDTGFDAEDLVQIGIGIRVDDEQRTLAALDEGVDHHAADRRFSDAALSGDSNGIGHGETSFVQWGNCRTAEPPGSRIISSCCQKIR